MPVSGAASALEAAAFVGRDRELGIFRAWLLADTGFLEILHIIGRGGIGKTALLHAFTRIALEHHRQVAFAEASNVEATSRGLLSALGGSAAEGVPGLVDRVNQAGALVLLDTFDADTDQTGWFQAEFLPKLAANVKVVIASRHPPALAWNAAHRATRTRPLVLAGFSPSEVSAYLRRRELEDPQLIEQVIQCAGSNPLALSLAVDVVQQFGIRNLSIAPEWHVLQRLLSHRLLDEVQDSQLRELIEASVVVRQFDEATLTAITGQDTAGSAFDQLVGLSIVGASDHGVMLHDDVRKVLAEDLRWRRPERVEALRSRAVTHFLERVRPAPMSQRDWLVAEGLFLARNAVIQEQYFCGDEPGQIWVEAGQPGHDVFPALFANWLVEERRDVRPGHASDGEDPGGLQFREAVLLHPDTRLRLARDRTGQVVGFSTVLPVCRQSIALLNRCPACRSLLTAYWSPPELAKLPTTASETNVFYLLHLVHLEQAYRAVRAALLRELSKLYALDGIYFCSTLVPSYKRLLEECGYVSIPSAQTFGDGPGQPADAYVLDLSQIGFESWMECILSGRRPPRLLRPAELEAELQAALAHWDDDGWLANSPLIDVPRVSRLAGGRSGAEALREAIREVLASRRAHATPELNLAFHALDVAFLPDKRSSRKQSARSLAVSRATFYRLTRRGIRELAKALSQRRS